MALDYNTKFNFINNYNEIYMLVRSGGDGEEKYRFGYNGQEKRNEIAGVGNHNTAQFWEYDTRLARRWNLDPVDQISISNYAVNGLNPIVNTDPLGDEWYKAKDGSVKFADHRLSHKEMRGLGYKKYLGETFSGYTDKGNGIAGNKNGGLAFSANLDEVTITGSGRDAAMKRAAEGGYLPLRIVVDLDAYVSAAIAVSDRGAVFGSKSTVSVPFGIQYSMSTSDGSSQFDIISGNNFYVSRKVSDRYDVRVVPLNGINKGEFAPGVRNMLTLGTYRKIKIQTEAFTNLRNGSLNTRYGIRGSFETPSDIKGIKIPYSLQLSGGIRIGGIHTE